MDCFKENGRVVEHASRVIRFLVRAIGIQSISFVGQLAQQVILNF